MQYPNRALVRRLVDRPAFPPLSLRVLTRRPRLLSPRMVSGVAKLWSRRGIAAFPSLAMFLPEGDEALTPYLEFIDDVLDTAWPPEPLLLCAVRRRDSRRAVFGPGGTSAPLASAIAASCAVPGYFAGVTIDGESYVDGGVISATNADVLGRHDIDLAIVISPMTGASGRPSLGRAIRRFCRRALDHEIRALARKGIPTVVIEPGPEVLRHVSLNFMSETASVEIVRQTFLDTGKQIFENAALHGLSTRSSAHAM